MKISGKFTILIFVALIIMILSGCSLFDETDESVDEQEQAGMNLKTVKFTPGATADLVDDALESASGTLQARTSAEPDNTDGIGENDEENDDEYDFGPSHTYYRTTRPSYTDGYAPNPTQPPVDPNEQGNSPENIAYGGFAAEKDGWIYYKNFADNGYLYRIKTDGTEKMMVTDRNISSINVVGNWIYYLDPDKSNYIHRVRPDGTNRLLIGKKFSSSINVVGSWIYIREPSFNLMFRIRTNGMDAQYMAGSTADHTSFYTVVGDTIYYINNASFYKIKTDGTEQQLISGDMNGITSYGFVGDWIYFTSTNLNDKLYCIRNDGFGLHLKIDMVMKYINVEGDRIYFEDQAGKICSINSDGTGLAQLTGPVMTDTGYNIAGGWIYYFNGSGSFCRIRTDGTENQLVT